MLKGPYDLDLVDGYVQPGLTGIYILSRDGKSVDYIGRSDTDLQREILQREYSHLARGRVYKYFWFEYAASPTRAYKRECELWHEYGAPPPDNDRHPAVPPSTDIGCPVPGCRYP